MTVEKHYSLEEVTEIIGVAVRTLRREIKNGNLRARKLSKSWRVSESDLQAYIDSAPANIPKQEPKPTAEQSKEKKNEKL